jgi:hypothetical protein
MVEASLLYAPLLAAIALGLTMVAARLVDSARLT